MHAQGLRNSADLKRERDEIQNFSWSFFSHPARNAKQQRAGMSRLCIDMQIS